MQHHGFHLKSLLAANLVPCQCNFLFPETQCLLQFPRRTAAVHSYIPMNRYVKIYVRWLRRPRTLFTKTDTVFVIFSCFKNNEMWEEILHSLSNPCSALALTSAWLNCLPELRTIYSGRGRDSRMLSAWLPDPPARAICLRDITSCSITL